MAISAAITLDRSSTTRTQKVRAVLVVSNSDPTNAVTVQNVAPFIQNTAFPEPQNSSAAIGQVVANGTVVPASGSATLVWDINFHTANPKGNYDTPPSQNTYNVGCLVYCDDGSVNSPSVQTVTIVPEKNYGSF